MAFVNEKTEDGVWRTIDKSRDIALVYEGRAGGDDPYKFSFHYKQKKIRIEAYHLVKTNKPGDNDITWKVSRLFIPEDLKRDKLNIMNLTSEAFDVCGSMFNRKYVSSVTTQFPTID